jgi:hypothetical protein
MPRRKKKTVTTVIHVVLGFDTRAVCGVAMRTPSGTPLKDCGAAVASRQAARDMLRFMADRGHDYAICTTCEAKS